MRKYIIALLLAVVVFGFQIQNAFAEVYTTEKTEGFTNCVYVAGSPDMYPVEFYDEEKKAYCGIIPDMLELISECSDIDFVYINGNKADKNAMGEKLQVEIVSSAVTDSTLSYYKDYAEFMSFEKEGETTKAGIIFTTLADDEMISKIKTALGGISADEKSGIYLSYASKHTKPNYFLIVCAVIIDVILIIAVVMLVLKTRRMRKEYHEDKMTDVETGMGNLQFFKYHFRNTIGDESRSLYYVAYILIDSSYLRSYHGESSFEEVLKYTATVLSDYTRDREISARIAESGFAFAFQSTNATEATRRIEEVMYKLNHFENIREQSNKIVFYAAVYHLGNSDKNSEILIFNLRKNCKKIFGTEKQIVSCDTQSMNKIQEENRIAESILNGFENDEFKMYLQFVVDNKTKNIVSAEALSRWESPKKGLIYPGKYIVNMEKAGLITKHDFHMFSLACRQLEKWQGTEFENIALSCNFTRITLSEENFIDRIKMIANSYSFDRSMLAIEITEDAIEKDRKTATENVKRCKDLGFRVYLDDLGSGYTSLANLCDYPIDVVKIDRDILLKAETGKGKALFTGIIALAHNLNIKVICEGVETEAQNHIVSSSHCDFVQGWYYSKVLPLEECESFIDLYSKS